MFMMLMLALVYASFAYLWEMRVATSVAVAAQDD